MNIVVDVGNTRTKYAFFRGSVFQKANCGQEELVKDLFRLKEEGDIIHLLLSGSGQVSDDLRSQILKMAEICIEADAMMELPLKIKYATQQTLGFDRIANCVGAMKEFPGCPLLVIDSGTCITFNYVDAEGTFLGGNISPGVELRFRSLHQYTAKLPLLEPDHEYGGIGNTTEAAIRNGVMNGMLFEVESYIKDFLKQFREGKVIITGGNHIFLKDRVMEKVKFCKNLGLVGLNEILIFTKKSARKN